MSGEHSSFAFTPNTIKTIMDEVDHTVVAPTLQFDADDFYTSVHGELVEAIITARRNGETTVPMNTEGEN